MANVKIVTESKDSFYVHLLSNAQPDVFKNKANHFKCRFQTALQFAADETWEVGLKEYHYVNNIDTISKDLRIEVGRLAPNRETWHSPIRSPISVVHDTAKVDYPFYFTECGTQLSMYKPFHDILSKHPHQQQHPNVISALLNFLQQQRLMSVLRIVRDGGTNCFQLKLRNTTNAIGNLYFPCQYVLCLSHPLALILQASTQCLRNENENVARSNGMWTQNAHSWLGNESHFNTCTLRTDVTPHKKLAATFVEVLCRRLKLKGWPPKITNGIFRNRMEHIKTFLDNCSCAQADDFTFTFVPLHRNKMQKIDLKTAQLTYVELFRHLEEMGYGSLFITPDQTSMTFTMHDLKDSKLFAVELPVSLFTRHNKRVNSFYQPQVRVDKWELEGGGRFVRKYNCPMENAFSTLELSYADDDNTLSGITTKALERELYKDIENDKEVPHPQQWVDTVYSEITKLEKILKKATVSFMRGRSLVDQSAVMITNETFLLTSNMRLTMTLDPSQQQKFVLGKTANKAVYTPCDYTLYDVKLPASPDRITVTSYTRSLDVGRYDIKKDATTFRDTYTSYNTITAPKGFYTPLSLIRYLQNECDKYQYPCTFSLVNKNGDDNDQGFLKIENSKELYLQFNPTAQELFQLSEPFLSPNSSFITRKPFDLQPDSFTNIIYCDIVGESVVGSQREKILCISPVQHSDYRYGQWAGKEFASADYYPLAMKTVQEIEIQLRGDTGDFIPITQGRSYMKLHFRRKAT